MAESNKSRVTFPTANSTTPWRNQQQLGSGSRTPFTSRSVSSPTKQSESKGKANSSNQPSSSAAATQRKTSKIECFKCGGHGRKQAECPNRRAIIALANGSYDSQSEEETEQNILASADENLETCEYQAEDGEYELGLNCLAIQSFQHVAHSDIPHVVIPPNPEEITAADFDDLLAPLNDLDAPISARHGSPFEPTVNSTQRDNLRAADHSLVVRRVLST